MVFRDRKGGGGGASRLLRNFKNIKSIAGYNAFKIVKVKVGHVTRWRDMTLELRDHCECLLCYWIRYLGLPSCQQSAKIQKKINRNQKKNAKMTLNIKNLVKKLKFLELNFKTKKNIKKNIFKKKFCLNVNLSRKFKLWPKMLVEIWLPRTRVIKKKLSRQNFSR